METKPFWSRLAEIIRQEIDRPAEKPALDLGKPAASSTVPQLLDPLEQPPYYRHAPVVGGHARGNGTTQPQIMMRKAAPPAITNR